MRPCQNRKDICMRILKFKVENQKIYQDPSCDFTGLVKGTSGYLKAFFSFSPEWNGCKIAASFWRMDKEYPILVQNGQCEIPSKALAWDYFGGSVTGIKDNGKFIITSDKITIPQRG